MRFQSRKRLSDDRRSISKVQFETLEPRNMLAADFGVTDAFSSSLLTHLANDVPVEARLDVLRAHLGADQGDSFSLISTTNDELGFQHFKYQHFHDGLPVESNHYTVHAKDGLIVSLSGEHAPVTLDSTVPAVSESEALQAALDYVGADIYIWQDLEMQGMLNLNDGHHPNDGHDHSDDVFIQPQNLQSQEIGPVQEHDSGCCCADCTGGNSGHEPGCCCSSCVPVASEVSHAHSHVHNEPPSILAGMTEYGPAHNQSNEISFDVPKGELVYASNRLTYKFDIYASQPMSRDYLYVDAITGEVHDSITRIHHVNVPASGPSLYDGNVDFTADFTGTQYRLRETGTGGAADVQTYDMNNGTNYGAATDFTNGTQNFTDPNLHTGNQTHWGTEHVRDYFLNEHNRNSFDDAGTTLRSYVSYRSNYVNAFWNGSFMTYGDGNGINRGPLVSLDIAGHELAHGVTQFTAGLIYRDQSGALNESFSDIFGEAVENYARGSNDWLMGGDIGINGNSGQFRSMSNPNQFNHADTYLGDYWRSDNSDVGGVHRNSGVQNKWFYIMVNGEAGTNDTGHTYNVTGVGMADAAAISYRNLSTYLSNHSTYPDARIGAIQSAIDLFGVGSQQHISTMEAWDAVGVYELQDELTLNAVQPLGSMIYADSLVSEVEYATDIQEFVLPLDSNQTLSLNLRTVTGNLIPTVTVLSPSGAVIGSATAGDSSEVIFFQSSPVVEDGDYLIQVTGMPDTGGDITWGTFGMDLQLNGDFEMEQLGFGTNDVIADAQAIDNSSVLLGDILVSDVDRLALIGVLGEGEISDGGGTSDLGDNFETGELGDAWEVFSSTANGRIEVTSDTGTPDGLYALSMDVSQNGLFNLNEAIWTIDLTDATEALLTWSETSFGDEIHLLPNSFNGQYFGDGVAISADGQTWFTISTGTLPNNFWQDIQVDLVQAATDFGIELGEDFKVKFQQYDNFGRPSDGRAYDNISFGGGSGANTQVDWYSFELDPNVPATVGLTQIEGNAEDLMLELFDVDENLLASGVAGVAGVSHYVENFTHAGTDPATIYVKVSGGSDKFSLVVTRNGGFDLETGSPQDLTNVDGILGYVSANVEVSADPDLAETGTDVSNFFSGVTLSNDANGNPIYAVAAAFYDAPTGSNVFSFIGNNDDGFQGSSNVFRADFDFPQSFVSLDVGSDDTLDIAFMRAYDVDDNLLEEVVSAGVPHSQSETMSITRPTAEIAYITASGFGTHTAPLDNLIFEQDVSDVDNYTITAAAGEVLEFTAYIPGEGPYEFRNRLVDADGRHFFMALLDTTGTLVVSGDEAISYVATASGDYELIVVATGGDGEYYIDRSLEFDTVRYDFGSPITELAADWEYADDSMYNPTDGLGWTGRPRGLSSGKFGSSLDVLEYDGIEVSEGVFVVDVPNGNYEVTIHHGYVRHRDEIQLVVEGDVYVYLPKISQVSTYSATVNDGQLTLEFYGQRDADAFARFAGLEITRLVTSSFDGRSGGDQGGDSFAPGLPSADEAVAYDEMVRPIKGVDAGSVSNPGEGRSLSEQFESTDQSMVAMALQQGKSGYIYEMPETLEPLRNLNKNLIVSKLRDAGFDQSRINKTGEILGEVLDDIFEF